VGGSIAMETAYYLGGMVSGVIVMNPIVKEFDYHPKYSSMRIHFKHY